MFVLLTAESILFFLPTNMKPQLVALIFLVTFVMSARAYYLRLHGLGKRASLLKKKSLSRLNSAGKTGNLKGKYYPNERN